MVAATPEGDSLVVITPAAELFAVRRRSLAGDVMIDNRFFGGFNWRGCIQQPSRHYFRRLDRELRASALAGNHSEIDFP